MLMANPLRSSLPAPPLKLNVEAPLSVFYVMWLKPPTGFPYVNPFTFC
jgi:hypothetical protein